MKQIINNIIKKINKYIFFIFCAFSINENKICFESEGDLSDNSFALFSYIMEHTNSNELTFVWFVSNTHRHRNTKNTRYVNKKIWINIVRRSFELATCKYYIYDHVNLFSYLYKRTGQKIIYLSHGCGYKLSKHEAKNKITSLPDVVFITSKIYINPMHEWSNLPKNIMKDVGYPRNDYLFEKLNKKHNDFINYYKLKEYRKVFLWMPTYRKSVTKYLSVKYDVGETDIPIIKDNDMLLKFNDFLCAENSMCFVKVHHLQKRNRILNRNHSNIVFLFDDDFTKFDLQLYQFIRITDALITDFSSVYNDYLLLDKPIIFTLDDYDKYINSEGLSSKNFTNTLKGEKVYCYLELTKAIKNIVNGNDVYKKERNIWKNKCHKYVDGNSSKRIINYLELSNVDIKK